MNDVAATGRVAVVTGASRGIGRSTALRLARSGTAVALVGRSVGALQAVLREVEEYGGQGVCVGAQLEDTESAGKVVATVTERFGRLDVVVNNAGFVDPRPVAEVTLERWNEMLAVHLTATFILCRDAVPWLRESPAGAVVNVASTSGLTGGTSGAHYAAAKGGVIALTLALARELAPNGIRVNAVAPSKVDTELLRGAASAREYAELARRVPLGRLGSADEIAAVIAFLASEQASYVTGEVVTVSGGYR